jgi:hypothetical protein
MTAFDDRIAPLLARLALVERNEERLAGRAESARADSVGVSKLVDRLAAQFPDSEARNPAGAGRPLRPVSPQLRRRWRARRRTITWTDCPMLAKAARSAQAEASGMATRRSRLAERIAAARRRKIETASVVRFFRGLMWRRRPEPPWGPSADLGGAFERVTKVAGISDHIEQRQTEFPALASELERAAQLVDECDAPDDMLME